MEKNRKRYKRSWISAFRKVTKKTPSRKVIVNDDYESDSDSTDLPYSSSGTATGQNGTDTTNPGENHIDDGRYQLPDVSHYKWYEEDVLSSDSSSDSESEAFNDSLLAEKLAVWANEFHVKHNAVDKLLHLLHLAGHRLPLTARSLLKTTKNVLVSCKSGMQYVYLGICKQLHRFVERMPTSAMEGLQELEISLNIDGLPLFKSSSTCVWPILCAVVNVKPAQVFPVALLCGSSKPIDLTFLNDTVNDLSNLLKVGLTVDKQKFAIRLRCIVCDAPAKALVKSVKLYSGYSGCDKCTQTGKWLGRMTYPEVSSIEVRTDKNFRDQCHTAHHHHVSPFCDLPIDMVKTFPIDYMHQVCLGVMRRLILAWLRGKPEVRISAGQSNAISMRLLSLRRCIPKLFARKPRTLMEVDRWKATEFRLFLLYIGKLVLRKILQDDLYEHFLVLSVAISFLVNPKLASSHRDYAEKLLLYFVAKCSELYGEEFIVYNIHSMVHMTAEAAEFGCLDNCSGFIFENYLQQIKKMVRSGRNPITQIVNRFSELSASVITLKPFQGLHISCKPPNNAYILDTSVCCEVVDDEPLSLEDGNPAKRNVLCRVYEKAEPLFSTPCDSRIIGCYCVSPRDASIISVDRERFVMQATMVEMEDKRLCFMAVLHDI